MNKRRLGGIARWLEGGAPHVRGNNVDFNMELWCGSACCIGGYTDQRWVDGDKDIDLAGMAVAIPALISNGGSKTAEALGLDAKTAVELFFPNLYLPNITPDWAARTVRHLIKTGKVDWEITRVPDR